MQLRLYDWGPSPFCLKVRAILDFKGLEYRRQNVLGRGIFDVRRRGGIGKVPALDIGGDLVCDSTDIAYRLERLCPQPSLLPKDKKALARCHAFEDWADESLYFVGLYYQWVEPSGAAQVPDAFGKGPVGRAAFRYTRRKILRQVRAQGTSRKPEAHVRADVCRHLEAIATLVEGRGFLLGSKATLCDFSVMAQLVYLGRTPMGKQLVGMHQPLQPYLARMKDLRNAAMEKAA